MIEEVVNSILEAEDVAQNKIAAARAEANEIVTFAETEADKLKKQVSAQNKAYYAQQSREIELSAAQNAKDQLAQLNAQTDKEVSAYQKNVDKAVKIILEHLK